MPIKKVFNALKTVFCEQTNRKRLMIKFNDYEV